MLDPESDRLIQKEGNMSREILVKFWITDRMELGALWGVSGDLININILINNFLSQTAQIGSNWFQTLVFEAIEAWINEDTSILEEI